MWMKVKMEASGWKTKWNEETGQEEEISEAEKWEFIREVEDKEGIKIDYHAVKYNPGLRYISKLMLYSLW